LIPDGRADLPVSHQGGAATPPYQLNSLLQLRRFGTKTMAMGTLNDDLLRAVELALAGDWDAAHNLVQQYEDNATAAWIHAVLHKMEGDIANSHYWYRRADRMDRVAEEPRAELAAIHAELTTDEHR
jgi:hypothetical protein